MHMWLPIVSPNSALVLYIYDYLGNPDHSTEKLQMIDTNMVSSDDVAV
jgi:hypothetical protein